MDSAKQKSLCDNCVVISAIMGWAVVGFNLAALIGWIFKIGSLVAISKHWSLTKPNIVIFALLAGTASLLNAPGRKKFGRVKVLLSALVSCAGLLTIFQRLTGVDTGFDTLFVREPILIPGMDCSLMVPLAPAINLFFAGLAVLLSDYETPKKHYPAQYLALFMILTSTAAIMAQLFGVTTLFFLPLAHELSISGTLTMFMLGVSILFSRPQKGIMRMVSSETFAGLAIRKVFPSAFIAMGCFGWLRWYFAAQGFLGSEFAATIMMYFGILTILVLILYHAGDVYRLEQEKMLVDGLLFENEKKLQAIMDNTSSIIVLTDIDRRIIFVNRQYEKVFGLPKEIAAGRMIQDICPEGSARTLTGTSEILNNGKSVEIEETVVTPSGPRTYITSGFSLMDSDGRPYSLVFMFTDITDRKAAEKKTLHLNEELSQANKELDAFTHSVSHDLRAPLRAIEGLLKIILIDYGPKLGDEGRQLLLRVCANSAKMLQLIEDLLAFSRFSQRPLNSASIDMTELAKNVIEEIKPQIPGRHVDFEVEELPCAAGDINLIRQVFVNLLNNAVKFTAGKKEAFVKVGVLLKDTDAPVYYVKDNGAGFDMQFLERLFGIFQRLHSQKDFEGTGVGLALVQRIVSRHGGRVWAEGKPNEGAVFYFTLAKVKGPA